MSENLTPTQHLTALVLAAPRERPYEQWQDSRPYCPLQRANVALGKPHTDLVELAADLGFTRAEAFGIMRGWDRATGTPPCFAEIATAWPIDVARGEAIGMQLAGVVGVAKVIR